MIPPLAVEGPKDHGVRGCGGPDSPDREHSYRFEPYALDSWLASPPDPTGQGVRTGDAGSVVATATLTGTYVP